MSSQRCRDVIYNVERHYESLQRKSLIKSNCNAAVYWLEMHCAHELRKIKIYNDSCISLTMQQPLTEHEVHHLHPVYNEIHGMQCKRRRYIIPQYGCN